MTMTKAQGITTVALLLALAGCGGDDRQACEVPPGRVLGFHDCNALMSDGTECVSLCGLPAFDGEPSAVLPDGCQVQVGTSTPKTATCVESCEVCR